MSYFRSGVYIPSPQQAALLKMLRAGWVLEKEPKWDDFYISHPRHRGYRAAVIGKTARSLIEHKLLVEAGEKGGFVTYAVK